MHYLDIQSELIVTLFEIENKITNELKDAKGQVLLMFFVDCNIPNIRM